MSNKKTRGPMYNIENAGDIHLSGNRTQGDELLKANNVGNITGSNNKAGTTRKQTTWFKKTITGVTIAVISGLILWLIIPTANAYLSS